MARRALAIKCWLERFPGLCRLRQLAIGFREREREGILLLGFSKEWVSYQLNRCV
jgi:hypothetical protein